MPAENSDIERCPDCDGPRIAIMVMVMDRGQVVPVCPACQPKAASIQSRDLVQEAFDALSVAAAENRLLPSEDFGDMLLLAGRDRAPALLHLAFKDRLINYATLAQYLVEVWELTEYPDLMLAWNGQWLPMFQAAGYTKDGEAGKRPEAALTMYRAAPARPAPLRRGHSWTDDLGQAREFMRLHGRGQFKPTLWVAEVRPERILGLASAVWGRTGENTYVIDTHRLRINSIEVQ